MVIFPQLTPRYKVATILFMTLKDLLQQFPDETACKEYLKTKRWPDVVRCPKCGSAKVFHVTHRPYHWVCKSGAETVDQRTGEEAPTPQTNKTPHLSIGRVTI